MTFWLRTKSCYFEWISQLFIYLHLYNLNLINSPHKKHNIVKEKSRILNFSIPRNYKKKSTPLIEKAKFLNF